MGRIDLHLHTNQSDGQYAPRALVALAADCGITLMSITDHDTIDGIAEGAEAAREAGMDFIPGIEISVKGDRELHILGYCIDCEDRELLRMNAEFVRLRGLREERIYAYLEEKGVSVSRACVRAYAAGGMVGRPHFARALVEAGYAADLKDAFIKYLSTPDFYAIERPKPTPRVGIDVIRAAGGIAVLAHPVVLRLSAPALDALLTDLVKEGLGGLECYYSSHNPNQTALYLSLARKHGLVVTGGSDFHGELVKRDVKIGMGVNGPLEFDDFDIKRKLYAMRWK
ncbi:MAG: PHP domain-containing protein [Clostridiales Family XIII bacterium]|jgi:predicted metal-dependent phosphoesterase TrpH|nr:PHP domain-containing protein [Clostridiales Family XIII bacterium]